MLVVRCSVSSSCKCVQTFIQSFVRTKSFRQFVTVRSNLQGIPLRNYLFDSLVRKKLRDKAHEIGWLVGWFGWLVGLVGLVGCGLCEVKSASPPCFCVCRGLGDS